MDLEAQALTDTNADETGDRTRRGRSQRQRRGDRWTVVRLTADAVRDRHLRHIGTVVQAGPIDGEWCARIERILGLGHDDRTGRRTDRCIRALIVAYERHRCDGRAFEREIVATRGETVDGDIHRQIVATTLVGRQSTRKLCLYGDEGHTRTHATRADGDTHLRRHGTELRTRDGDRLLVRHRTASRLRIDVRQTATDGDDVGIGIRQERTGCVGTRLSRHGHCHGETRTSTGRCSEDQLSVIDEGDRRRRNRDTTQLEVDGTQVAETEVETRHRDERATGRIDRRRREALDDGRRIDERPTVRDLARYVDVDVDGTLARRNDALDLLVILTDTEWHAETRTRWRGEVGARSETIVRTRDRDGAATDSLILRRIRWLANRRRQV